MTNYKTISTTIENDFGGERERAREEERWVYGKRLRTYNKRCVCVRNAFWDSFTHSLHPLTYARRSHTHTGSELSMRSMNSKKRETRRAKFSNFIRFAMLMFSWHCEFSLPVLLPLSCLLWTLVCVSVCVCAFLSNFIETVCVDGVGAATASVPSDSFVRCLVFKKSV